MRKAIFWKQGRIFDYFENLNLWPQLKSDEHFSWLTRPLIFRICSSCGTSRDITDFLSKILTSWKSDVFWTLVTSILIWPKSDRNTLCSSSLWLPYSLGWGYRWLFPLVAAMCGWCGRKWGHMPPPHLQLTCRFSVGPDTVSAKVNAQFLLAKTPQISHI